MSGETVSNVEKQPKKPRPIVLRVGSLCHRSRVGALEPGRLGGADHRGGPVTGNERWPLLQKLLVPGYEWRPWQPGFRVPTQLGWRAGTREYLRRLVGIAFATVFLAVLPVLIIVAVILLILALIALALSALDGDENKQQPVPVHGIHQLHDPKIVYPQERGRI